MGKFSFISIGVLGLLVGCTDSNKSQVEQLAKIQSKLEEQERQNYLLQAQIKASEEQHLREEEFRKVDEQNQGSSTPLPSRKEFPL